PGTPDPSGGRPETPARVRTPERMAEDTRASVGTIRAGRASCGASAECKACSESAEKVTQATGNELYQHLDKATKGFEAAKRPLVESVDALEKTMDRLKLAAR